MFRGRATCSKKYWECHFLMIISDIYWYCTAFCWELLILTDNFTVVTNLKLETKGRLHSNFNYKMRWIFFFNNKTTHCISSEMVPCHADCWLCGNHLYWFNVLFPYRTWEVRNNLELECQTRSQQSKSLKRRYTQIRESVRYLR